MKIVLLSNINIDPVIRQLSRINNIELLNLPGYGNELGIMLNKESVFYDFQPEMVFIFIDVMEMIHHDIDISNAGKGVDEWFTLFGNSLCEDIIYYISDAYLYGPEIDVVYNKSLKQKIEYLWNEKLYELIKNNSNIRIFPYCQMIQRIGEDNAFSNKMWYLGRILHSNALHKKLAYEIKHIVDMENRQPKKVLLLDLDNTLWGGLVGENDVTPIVLSDSGIGLAFKNFQRGIKQLKDQGVILGIVSKNNEEEAMDIIKNHTHMILRPDDFAICKINWKNKAENISLISQELNVGLDSVVFIDDNPAERALIRDTLPDVMVPDFPDGPEKLTDFVSEIYHSLFEKTIITEEDQKKTEQYRANDQRKKMLENSLDYDAYLDSLEMKLYRVDPKKNKDRLIQLINKTNQFNLTTIRLTEQELSGILSDRNMEVFLYRVTDRFGDNGIVAAAIMEYDEEAVIREFTMSCRVMGRRIEGAIIEDLENSALKRGYREIIGKYKATGKNAPVENLYSSFGYTKKKVFHDGMTDYALTLGTGLKRKNHLKRIKEDK